MFGNMLLQSVMVFAIHSGIDLIPHFPFFNDRYAGPDPIPLAPDPCCGNAFMFTSCGVGRAIRPPRVSYNQVLLYRKVGGIL